MTIGQTKHRSMFISDVHLGSHQCKAKRLYEFLYRNDADTIYLIGDILEGASLKKWPPFHDEILKILAKKALKGTRILFIPGNHDSFFRHHTGQYGNLLILKYAHHIRVDGTMLLVTHGDETDFFKADFILWLIVKFERLFHLHLWEILKRIFKTSMEKHVRAYERKVLKLLAGGGYSGIICGHLHLPKIEFVNGSLYLNSGDWTTHCSAIVESYTGELELIYG